MSTKIKICEFCKEEFLWKRGMSFTKKNCSKECHSNYMASKRFGKNNPAWKGNDATVTSKHCWVRDNFKKKDLCEHCGKYGKTDWSNKYHTYLRKREDWQELCRSCHQIYDYANGLRIRENIKNRKQYTTD
jgi:hypothetical protein